MKTTGKKIDLNFMITLTKTMNIMENLSKIIPFLLQMYETHLIKKLSQKKFKSKDEKYFTTL